jgi:hypothetical protein
LSPDHGVSGCKGLERRHSGSSARRLLAGGERMDEVCEMLAMPAGTSARVVDAMCAPDSGS